MNSSALTNVDAAQTQNSSHSHTHSHSNSHSHSHGGASPSPEEAAGNDPKPSPAALLWTQTAILGLVGLVLYITISFCTGVYFDRESAFRNALRCSEEVMNKAGVVHWLQNGTLLGATRLGRLILWDADLDYGFLSEGSLAQVSADLDTNCFGYRSTTREGTINAGLQVWRKCTHRLCAEFHQAKVETQSGVEMVVTGSGASPAAELLPLGPCVVAEVDAKCPHNAPYFLAQAYGTEWLTKPLTKLF